MITLGVEAQQKAKDALQRVDKAILADLEMQHNIKEQSEAFRDLFFGTFEYIERESMLLEEVFIKKNRVDANQLEVQNKNYPSILLFLDTEVAFDSKPPPSNQPQGSDTRWVTALGARLFAVLQPPKAGLLRYYTIFADGSWKRTVFTLLAQGVQTQSVLVPKFNADVLILESIDLLGYACTLHPSWANLVDSAETFTTDMVQKRTITKEHLTGLGGSRMG